MEKMRGDQEVRGRWAAPGKPGLPEEGALCRGQGLKQGDLLHHCHHQPVREGGGPRQREWGVVRFRTEGQL